MNTEIKIVIPEGYEIDRENSTFECIKLKPIKRILSYDDIVKELFFYKEAAFIDGIGHISKGVIPERYFKDETNCTSEKQAKRLLAINKLMNIAKFLNDGWIPEWNTNELKWYIAYNSRIKLFMFLNTLEEKQEIVYFKTDELAEQAFDILGKEEMELIFSTDW